MLRFIADPSQKHGLEMITSTTAKIDTAAFSPPIEQGNHSRYPRTGSPLPNLSNVSTDGDLDHRTDADLDKLDPTHAICQML